MLELLSDPQAWIAFATLTALEAALEEDPDADQRRSARAEQLQALDLHHTPR